MNKTLSMLGLCRRAGKMSPGHDAAFDAIRSGRAKLAVLTRDASARHMKDIKMIKPELPVLTLDCTAEEIGHATGKRICVFTVDDEYFASSVLKKSQEEDIVYGSKI